MVDARILIVEDEPISRAILEETLANAGYNITVTETASEAWEQLAVHRQHFDAILLDRNLPDINGLELLGRIKSEPSLPRTPVIMQTAMTAPEDIQAGLLAGAHYYLTKPLDISALLSIVSVAIKDYCDFRQLQQEAWRTVSVLSQLSHARFQFRNPQQARDIATLLPNACPDGRKVVLGLSELMLNAVEHGNLAITYAEKSRLLQEGRLDEEIQLRLSRAEYASRAAVVGFERGKTEICFVIRDDGAGFDWRNYLELSPERAFDLHGRGQGLN